MTKAELYRLIEEERQQAGLSWRGSPFNAEALSRQHGIDIEYIDFKTRGLRGVALVSHGLTLLSSRLTKEQRNFYACHELLHHLHHRGLRIASFQCYDLSVANGAYYEWEANEGAAEMLVPYRVFLRFVGQRRISCYLELRAVQVEVACMFRVPLRTAVLRFDSLKYELRQYMDGVPLTGIWPLSDSAQAQAGIFVKSFNELFPAPKPAGRPVCVWDD